MFFQVFSQNDSSIIARSPEQKTRGMKEIYLLLQDNHFDLITSITGFLACSYYCHDCDEGYCNKERHYSENVCSECHFGNEECFWKEEVLS